MVLCCAGMLCGGGDSDSVSYGKVPPARYLTGRFDVKENPLFVELSALKIPTDGRAHYLRREAAVALARMAGDFRKQHPKIKFFVRSSTRTWQDQKCIWENKWSGRTLVEGKKLNETIKDPRLRALKILEYSSMPGTSRHHWGTDFDINNLVNSYYEAGEGKVILDWLEANAGRYGFSRPYTAGRKAGYNEEKWHWSYTPLSRLYTRRWMALYGNNPKLMVREDTFMGAGVSVMLAPVYVQSVNGSCR